MVKTTYDKPNLVRLVFDYKMTQYVRGNFVAFGFWSGLRANVTLLFPVMNWLLNRKHFGKELRF